MSALNPGLRQRNLYRFKILPNLLVCGLFCLVGGTEKLLEGLDAPAESGHKALILLQCALRLITN